jgi:hypothetical protein
VVNGGRLVSAPLVLAGRCLMSVPPRGNGWVGNLSASYIRRPAITVNTWAVAIPLASYSADDPPVITGGLTHGLFYKIVGTLTVSYIIVAPGRNDRWPS